MISGEAPLVSVVVACRNESVWIVDTIRSVLDQTHRHLELVVVDDGSTDGTADIAESIPDPRIRVVRQSGRGACAARNAGLRLISGTLVQMLDGDDLLAPDKIERQVARWRSEGDSVVYCGPFGRFVSSPQDAVFAPEANWRDMSGHDWLVSAWSDGGMMATHSWLTPIALTRAAGEWDESLLQNQDGEYFSRVLLASAGVRYCADSRCYYRVGNLRSISRAVSHGARESLLRSTLTVAERLLAIDAGLRVRNACANAIEEVMFLTYPQYRDLSAVAQKRLGELGGGDGTQRLRGPVFKRVSALLGWRAACVLKRWQESFRRRFRRA